VPDSLDQSAGRAVARVCLEPLLQQKARPDPKSACPQSAWCIRWFRPRFVCGCQGGAGLIDRGSALDWHRKPARRVYIMLRAQGTAKSRLGCPAGKAEANDSCPKASHDFFIPDVGSLRIVTFWIFSIVSFGCTSRLPIFAISSKLFVDSRG